jgi:thioredoxin-dependent peroxiredoxin
MRACRHPPESILAEINMVEVGKKVKNFKLPATGDQDISLNDLKGKKVVLYFYPKDSTPGCTTEGQDFRDAKAKFSRQNTVILGVSRDSIKSHENFKAKQNFNFELLSDADEALCAQFDVIKMKNMYGKQVRGIERSTFLIDDTGVLRQEWRKVKVKEHVQEVLDAVKALK